MWAWACEHEQIYLEYFNDTDKFFFNFPMPHRNDVKNIFPRVHGWKSKLDEMFGWKIHQVEMYRWNYFQTNYVKWKPHVHGWKLQKTWNIGMSAEHEWYFGW